MPMTRSGYTKAEEATEGPRIISMRLCDAPLQRGKRGLSELGRQIEEMEPSEVEPLFVPLEDGLTAKQMASRVTSTITNTKKRHPERSYTRRVVKHGVVDGVAVWRLK